MITKARLENWRCHGSTELEFLQGTNVLIGVMGAGKSAVLDAISFALFGTFPALASKKASIDSCVMSRPEQKSKASIEVFFKVNGKDYSILREITVGKGTTRSELREGEELLEGPQTKRVTEEVVRLLGMDYDLFSRAVYSEQNQIDYFLQIPSGQRKKKIDELLKISRFEKARATTSSLSRGLRAEAAAIHSQLKGTQMPDVEKEKAALESLEKRVGEAREKLASAKSGLADAEAETKRLEGQEKKIESLRGKISSAESKAEVYSHSQREIGAELEKAKGMDVAGELRQAKEKLASAAEKILALEKSGGAQQKAGAERKKTVLEGKVRQLEEKLDERKRLLDEKEKLDKGSWREKLESARLGREELLSRQKELGVIITDAEERLGALSKAGDHCPVCDSEISAGKRGELEKSAGEKQGAGKRELEELKKKLAAVDVAGIEEKVRALDSLEARLRELYVGKELSEAREALATAEKEAVEISAGHDAGEKELRALREEKEELLSSITRLDALLKSKEKLAKIVGEKEALAGSVKELKQALDSLEFDGKALAAAREKSKELSARVGELESEARNTAELAGEKKRLIHEMAERQKELGSLKRRGEGLEAGAASMEVFRKAVEDTQVQLREQFVTGVNDALGMIWEQVYPYKDYSRLRLGVEGGDYALEVLAPGGDWVNVEGFASGGEKSTAALALRIAFSMVLAPQLSWLVLDEPTHNLDSNGVAQLSKTMRETLPGLVEQIFIITHDDEMEAAVSGNLYRIERDKAESGAARAVLVSGGKG
ncbi:MAG: SMC family ATPase [Candidatus Diapherotrites archaeon]|nr:SMC family ATPase [Candidatus Diapherotrites archaeon]